jgi:hypothetical protein
MKKAELSKASVLDLHGEVERITERMTAIQQERDKLLAEALALHEEREPLETELAERAWVMRDPEVPGGRMTVPRMVLNAREAAESLTPKD